MTRRWVDSGRSLGVFDDFGRFSMNGTGMFTIEVAGQRHDFDDAQIAAVAFLSRYSDRTLEA